MATQHVEFCPTTSLREARTKRIPIQFDERMKNATGHVRGDLVGPMGEYFGSVSGMHEDFVAALVKAFNASR